MDEELLNEIKSLRAELDDLKSLVHEGIIKPIEDDYNNRKYKEATDIWTERYKDKLEPYVEKLKATDGEDFDLFKSSYDAWNETDADPDEWVDMLIKQLEEDFAPLAKVFGVEPENLNATIEVKDGEIADVKADTEPETSEGEEVAAEPSEEEVAEEEVEEEPSELSEEEQFQKELDDAYEKYKGQRSY